MPPFNTDISLSTASIIEDSIQHALHGFSTTRTMGAMVNNVKFADGFNELVAGQKTERSYIWESLSAVSEDLGQSLYQNVKNYIDNVANVDTCKVRALKSMMSILGSDYKVLDKINYYPIEIQNLIDILSISKKYLFNNQYIKKDFLDACVADGLASCLTPEQMLYNNQQVDAISSNVDYYLLKSDDAFGAYLSGIYSNFIYDMLSMRGSGICADVELYKTGFFTNEYGKDAHLSDKYLFDKRDLNVSINFNVEQTVNDIDAGIDSLDNYSGDELSLLMKEIDWRKQPASNTLSMDLATRYIYYRKRKVIEYAEFVDNMAFLPANFNKYIEYAYDTNYLTMLSDAQYHACISLDASGQYAINDDYVKYTAMSLAQITRYIAKIRDTIRLQTRKVFMKGTNNLLRYTANEFVIDYMNTLKSSMPFSAISSFIAKLSAHSIDDVMVQEYWDLTEYMNLSTETTPFAANSYLANSRFFDDTFSRINGKLVPESNNIFTNEQLNEFYLDKLGIKNTVFPVLSANGLASDLSSNFYEFLSTLFNVAASTAYYNENRQFGMKLPNNAITEQINSDLLSTKTISAFIADCATSAGYQFEDGTTVQQQVDDLSKQLYDILQAANHEGISSTYDKYYPLVQDLSSAMNALTSDFSNLVNDTYINYFGKSSSIYCYDQDGNYLFDYYVGDGVHSFYTDYETSAASVRDWINDGHCFSFALSAVIENLSSAYNACYSQITSIIESDLQSLDYIDPKNADLGGEMDDMQEFVNTKISQRNTYLVNTLQSLRDQIAQAKQDYTSAQNTFSSVLASLPNLPHQNFYMVGCDAASGEGTHRLIDPVDKNKYLKKSIYDAVSQARYVESTEYGTFKKVECEYLDELIQIDQNQPLEVQIEQCMHMFDEIGKMSFGASTSVMRTSGAQKTTLQSIQASINSITSSTIPSIVKQLKTLYNIDIDTAAMFTGKTCIQQIENLMSYLTTEVSEQNFNGDAVIQKYYQVLGQINEISNEQYVPARSQYEAMWTEFESFFIDYSKGSSYRQFLPVNLSSVDEFRQKKDNIALNEINAQLDQLNGQYDALVKQFVSMCTQDTIVLYGYDSKRYQYTYPGNALEYCIADFIDKMHIDINVQDILATENSDAVINKLQLYVELAQSLYKKYMSYAIEYSDAAEYIEKFNALDTSLMSLVQDILDKLEYNDSYEYTYSKELFQNYSGVQTIATDPYYNIKNQTHPSYQIHPFMWYFIEYHLEQTALDVISKDVIGISYDLLESTKIAQNIDTLLGKFGNVVNVWKTNMLDFTGYTTKYEQSNHVCERTGRWNEVVGYEGAFYPPALSAYLKNQKLSSLNAYYSHLKLDADSSMKSIIEKALSDSYGSIKRITSDCQKAQVYDIYKYYVDSYGNMYILYKTYNDDNPSEKTKLTTAGELWIRLADSPLAFPLTSIVDMQNSSDFLPGSSSEHSLDSICDICMIDSGAKIVLTGYKAKNGYTYTQSRPLYIEYDVKDGCGVGRLRLMPTNMHSNRPNEQTSPFPHIDYTNASKPPEWMYLGSLNRNAITIDVVYIQFNNSTNSIPADPTVKIFTVTSTEIHGYGETTYQLSGITSIIDNFPVISNHDDSNNAVISSFVDIMLATPSSTDGVFESPYTKLKAGKLIAASGHIFNDPIHTSMNSLDLMAGDLVLKSICVNPAFDASTRKLQTNTDMGYIPSYAYDTYENVLDVKKELASSHQIVELLGKSKDIDDLASRVITDPDPYITKKTLFDKYMYGRIYEDDGMPKVPGDWNTVQSFSEYNAVGDCSFDQSINIYSNWQMYPNMPNSYDNDYVFNYVDGHYQWNIRLDNRYTYERLRQLRLFIYSTIALGKNPYVVAEMSDVIDACSKLAQNEFLSTNYDASHYEVTTYSFNDHNFVMQVAGTQNGIDQVDSFFSNALPNIIDFKYKYATLGGGMYLKLDFKLNDVNADGYIDSNVVKVALVDMFDLSFYNWYHFIDPGVTDYECQRVLNRLSGNPLLRQEMLAIDFSNYTQLSDVQIRGIRIFETNSRIQFKIDEADMFNISSYNYYVPSLNLKYPLTFAQTFDKIYNIPEELLKHSVNVYDPDEEYVLEVTDAEVLSALNGVQMMYNDFPDDYRVYEDYFHVGTNGIPNNDRFCTSDPFFYQYVHFMSDVGVDSNDISIDQSACVDVRIDGTDVFSMHLNMLNVGLSAKQSERGESHASSSRMFDFKALDPGVKKNIIEHVKKFMRLNFSYAKTKDNTGIVLYANYQNYINSPYVKLVNGLPYLDLLPDTYLKLYPDQSGIVSIVVQFRQYLNGVLMGINNVTVATYKVYNVSDDKPKFVIERQDQLG